MNIFGIFIGYLLPALFVDEYSEDVVLTPERRDSHKQQIFTLQLVISLIATVILLGVIFGFRERPGMPICGKKEQDERIEIESDNLELPLMQ